MKPLIEPKDYADSSTFRTEIDRIFLRQWIFACSTHGLEKDGDFLCIDVGSISVVIQNFSGKIRAFNNVCTHRFSRLQTERCGNRELKCPYHGWIYNEAGLPYAIPKKPLISEVTPKTLCEYRLSRWHVRLVGPLVFIRKEHADELIADDDLENQFADFFEPLTQLSTACGDLVENTSHSVQANWKLVVENTLEGYHVDCVHPNTIRKLGIPGLSTGPTAAAAPESASRFSFSARNSAVFSPLNAAVSEKMDRTYKFLANRPQRLSGYRHFYFFPNFVIASTRGESFSIQRILPRTENSTELTSFLFATNGIGELTKMEAALHKQFYTSAAEFVRDIFLEDANICEQVQRSIGFAHGMGVLSDEEERICAFHQAYHAAIAAKPATAVNQH